MAPDILGSRAAELFKAVQLLESGTLFCLSAGLFALAISHRNWLESKIIGSVLSKVKFVAKLM